ncbi:amidohydrolase [bacterium]|nr:amidohydrolase [bacterium]
MTLPIQEIKRLARQFKDEIIEIRRDIHQHPEIGFEVQRTAKIAANACLKLGLKVTEGVGRTGVVADLIIDPKANTIALRADMDALPMQEEGDCEYKSTVPGAAHMCGHDAHTAMLIGAAKILTSLKDQLKCNVRFVFQPNEENFPGGAPGMIEDGVLKDVGMIFGLHVWPEIASKSLGLCVGPAMAKPDEFKIYITGKGGHAAEPHLAIDPIIVGAQIITQLQSIVSRNVSPFDNAVLSFTEFHSGSTHNVIPEKAFLHGTIRTFRPEVQIYMRETLQSRSRAIAESFGAKLEIEYIEGYPVTFNHDDALSVSREVAQEIFGKDQVIMPASPTMGGEDFGYYSQEIPACFAFLGIRNEEKGICRMCHDPRFDVDEDCFVEGMSYHAGVALSFK